MLLSVLLTVCVVVCIAIIRKKRHTRRTPVSVIVRLAGEQTATKQAILAEAIKIANKRTKK